MKNTIKYLFGGLLIAGVMTACSPEEYDGLNESGVPQASAFAGNIKATVDQSLNQVTLELADAKGLYPYWEIELPNGKIERSTLNPYTKIYTKSGDYNVKVRVGNRDGLSDGTYETTLHIDNSIFDFGKYYTLMSKESWHIANNEKGHMGCGEPGTEGLNWWSANENDKSDWGVYDNDLTFTADNKYTFTPGEHGTIFVNTGCSIFAEYNTNDGNDFNVPVEEQTTTYNLEVDGDDLFLTFPAQTYFPYIANDDVWNSPRYKVISMTAKKMVLVSDNGAIAWHYILTTAPRVTEEKPDQDKPQGDWTGDNLLAGMPIKITQYYAPGWAQIADAEYTAENGVYTISYPSAAPDQWQAQFTFNETGISLDPEKSYDFRVKIVSNNDHPGVTVKLTQQDNDDIFLSADRHKLVGGEETWIELIDLKVNKDQITNLKIPFDFGGVEEGTEVTISYMHLQEHKGPKTINWGLTGEKNLWLKGSHATASFYYAPGWAQIADPEVEIDGNSYTINLPEATTDQWQAQWHITTELTDQDIVAGKAYDIRFTIIANEEQPGITFKLTEDGNDDNFLTADRHAYTTPDEEQIVEIPGVSLAKGENTKPGFKLALDFAGNPAGSVVTIKDIIIQEAE